MRFEFSLCVIFSIVATAGSVWANDAEAGARIKERFGIEEYNTSSLMLPENPVEQFSVTVEHEGSARVIHFQKHSVRGPNYQLLVQAAGGELIEVEPGPVRTYRGFIEDEPDAVVAGTLLPSGLKATVFSDYEPAWSIRPMQSAVSGADRSSHIIYMESDIEQPDLTNDKVEFRQSEDGRKLWPYNGAGATVPIGAWAITGALAHAPYGCTVKQAELSLDIEYLYYVWQGSSITNVEDNIDASINYINTIYVRDCLIEHVLGRVIIRTNQATCPYYDATSLYDCWHAAGEEWTTNQSDVSPNMVAMISSNRFGGGLASGPGNCFGASAFSANGPNSGIDGEFYIVLRHELGHNWGAADFHQGCPEGYTIMCGNANPGRFSGLEVASIIAVRDSLPCLTDIGAWPTTVPPYAAFDRAFTTLENSYIVIDVLANDHDANCDTIVIDSFDSVSELGAAVTLSVGTGPDGRDELIYTLPPVEYGTDRFTYIADDGTGQLATGNVEVIIGSEQLKGYWKLDETTGTFANDSSNNGLDGTVTRQRLQF